MNRRAIYEIARDKMNFLKRERERTKDELPELRGRLHEAQEFLDKFKGDDRVERKAYRLVAENATVPQELNRWIAQKEEYLDRLELDMAEWSFIFARLKEMWPDLVAEDEEA